MPETGNLWPHLQCALDVPAVAGRADRGLSYPCGARIGGRSSRNPTGDLSVLNTRKHPEVTHSARGSPARQAGDNRR
jgi:hypothetical protein